MQDRNLINGVLFFKSGFMYANVHAILALKKKYKKSLKKKNETSKEKITRKETANTFFINMIKNFVCEYTDPNYTTFIDVAAITVSLFQKESEFINSIVSASSLWDYSLPTKCYILNAPYIFAQIWKSISPFISKESKAIISIIDATKKLEISKCVPFEI
jgi:hypothetical protein